MAELKDSGARRAFESGAVRDIAEGKGRCDLLPLGVVSRFLGNDSLHDVVLCHINSYISDGDTDCLLYAIKEFCRGEGIDPYTAMLEVSKHYEDGARKYAERNWEKGLDVHCFIDSGVRHYLKHKRGDIDEPHNRAFIWNMLGAVWTHQNKPELIDLPFKEKRCCVAPDIAEDTSKTRTEKKKSYIETCFG